jgi:outer membrane protein assembly factor BamB
MLVGLLMLLFAASPAAGDWPRFRGPNGNGVDEAAAGLPSEFGPSKNVVWKSTAPYGQSSPVVAAGRIFLTAGDKDALVTLCYDAKSGKLLWRRDVPRAHRSESFKANDPASPSPATDGTNVYAFFQDLGLISYTGEGKERWRHALGPFQNYYGLSSSPVVAGGMVLISCDQRKGSFLLAVDAETGKQRWKADRGNGVGWGVPVVHEAGGDSEVVMIGTSRVDSYDLATGAQRWWLPISSEGAIGTPVYDGNTLIVCFKGHDEPWMPTFEATLAQYDKDRDGRLSRAEFAADRDWGEHFGWIDDNSDGFVVSAEWTVARNTGAGDYGVMAIQPGAARGRLPATAVKWRMKRNLPYIPSPVLYRGVYFMVRTGGIVTSIDPATGKILKQGRSERAGGEYYASPVAADGKVYLLNEEGKLSVLKAAPQWEVLSVNDLAEETHATPAISGGRIYVRTRSQLYSFASPATARPAADRRSSSSPAPRAR